MLHILIRPPAPHNHVAQNFSAVEMFCFVFIVVVVVFCFCFFVFWGGGV